MEKDAAAFLEVWENDRAYALLCLSHRTAQEALALAKAVAALQGVTVGTIFAAWFQDSTRTTIECRDYSTR